MKGGLVGGYYDAGDNIKFHFPMSYSMTMLSWSVIEYPDKYKNINEYNHARDLIKWGTDYLLLTFNSSATKITKIYCQVFFILYLFPCWHFFCVIQITYSMWIIYQISTTLIPFFCFNSDIVLMYVLKWLQLMWHTHTIYLGWRKTIYVTWLTPKMSSSAARLVDIEMALKHQMITTAGRNQKRWTICGLH